MTLSTVFTLAWKLIAAIVICIAGLGLYAFIEKSYYKKHPEVGARTEAEIQRKLDEVKANAEAEKKQKEDDKNKKRRIPEPKHL